MQAIYNTKTSIITRLIDTSDQNIGKYLEENEDYKYLPFRNDLSVGENINKFTDEGRLRPNSELVVMGLITLGDDEVLEDEVIRELTEEELKIKYPERYPTAEELALAEELQTVEAEIKTMEDEALKSLIQSRLNEEI